MKKQIFKSWLILLGCQLFSGLTILADFMFGKYHFAYLDIGYDSYSQFVPYAMYMARTIPQEGWTGWSFIIGLGNPTAWMHGDSTLMFFAPLAGTDGVLSLRIWMYLFKILTGGTFFFLWINSLGMRKETALISAFAYSFCGFIVANGQWDPQATEFVFYPLILWAIVKHLQTGDVIVVPVSVAASLIFGVFFVALGVFFLFAGVGHVLIADNSRTISKIWLFRLFPLSLIGFFLAAPLLLPVMLQMLDSSRVGGEEALFGKILSQSLTINDWHTLLVEIGSIFHKDIFGIGNQYKGFSNYLEGPEFFFGIMLFIIIPQLWKGSKTDRKILFIAFISIISYFIFPVFRCAAMGFAAPYFRVSTLWITLVFLLLAARALNRSIEKGIDEKMVLAGVGICLVLIIALLSSKISMNVSLPHIIKVIGIAFLSGLYLILFSRKVIGYQYLPTTALCLIVIEIILISTPSFFSGRSIVPVGFNAFDDGTPKVLHQIRKIDDGIYRIEKTYDSVSLADSLAQNYMGIKSYFFHSRGVVDFFIETGLISV